MAPEQIFGEAVDERTDLFSFGILSFELVTGQTAVRGEDVLGSDGRDHAR